MRIPIMVRRISLLLLTLPLMLVIGGRLAAAEASSTPPNAAPQPAPEYNVKAALLLAFTRYVEWPAASFSATDATLKLCVFGRDPFSGALDKAVAGRASGGHPLAVEHFQTLNRELRSCQLVFVTFYEQRRENEVLRYLEGYPVLTIGETDTFLRNGGAINFLVEKTVQFEVNSTAADESKLTISSRMLALARQVYASIRDLP